MYSDSDILDHPETPKLKPSRTFLLIYIELSFVLFWGALSFWKISLREAPIFLVLMLIYCAIAPFLKPQFIKGKSLRTILGIWNIGQTLLLGLTAFFMIQGFPMVLPFITASFSSLAIYYLTLPFVESDTIKSLRFLNVLLFGLGFSILFVGMIFMLNAWPYVMYLIITGTTGVGIAALMMLLQLILKKETPIYYWFYLPRVAGLGMAWFLAFLNL